MTKQAHLSDELIETIASDAARNVCEHGSTAAASHNTKTIASAIRSALAQSTIVTIRRKTKTQTND